MKYYQCICLTIVTITISTLILISISIISSGIGSTRSNTDGIWLIPLHAGAIDVEASLCNAIVVMLLIIGDTKELETIRIGFSIICLIACNVDVVLQSNTTLLQWFVVACNTSVGMILTALELAGIGVLSVVLCNGMEDGFIELFFDVIKVGVQSSCNSNSCNWIFIKIGSVAMVSK